MQVAHGTFTASLTGTQTGNQSVTGLGIGVPSVLLVYGVGPTADGATAAKANSFVGFATSATQRAVVAGCSDDALATVNAGKSDSNTRLISLLADAGPTQDALADFVSFDADGFTINWLDAPATAFAIHFVAWSGADIAGASVQTIAVPTASGPQAVSFGAPIDFAMFVSPGVSSATSSADDVTQIGFAARVGSDVQQACVGMFDNDAATNHDAAVTQFSRSLRAIDLFGTTAAIEAAAGVTAFTPTGLTLNWNPVPASAGRIVYALGIQGGAWRVGYAQKPAANGATTITVPGVTPKGVLCAGVGMTADGTTTTQVDAQLTFGAAVGTLTAQQSCISNIVIDAATASKNSRRTGACMRFLTGATPTVAGDAAVTALAANSFDLTWSSVNATAYQFIYAVCGDAPPTGLMGRPSIQLSWFTLGSNEKEVTGSAVATAFSSPGSGALRAAYLFLDGGVAAGTQGVRAVIYRGSTIAAATLLALSNEVVIAGSQRPGWVRFTFASAPQINVGDLLWVGYFAGATALVARITYASATSGTSANSTADTYPTASSPFGTQVDQPDALTAIIEYDALQFARPISDVAAGLWTPTPLWSRLSETVADDTTDMQSSATPASADVVEIKLGTITP